MEKKAFILPPGERTDVLFTLPSQAFLSDAGEMQTGPFYTVQNDEGSTTWGKETPEGWDTSDYTLTRLDVTSHGYREVQMGERKPQGWVTYTVENPQRTLKLTTSKSGEVYLFSLFLRSQVDEAQPAFCAFDYRDTGDFDVVRLTLDPGRAFMGKEPEKYEDPVRYYLERPLGENLREYAQAFGMEKDAILATVHEEESKDREEEDEQERQMTNQTICELGFPEAMADNVRGEIQAIIAEEVEEATGGILDGDLIPYFVDELMQRTISCMVQTLAAEQDDPGLRLGQIQRAEVLNSLADFIGLELSESALLLVMQRPTHVEIEFLTEEKDQVRYTVIEQGPTPSQGRVVCREDKRKGESFRFDIYNIECHSLGGNVLVDVGGIKDNNIQRFIGPGEVDLLKFHNMVTFPFSSGVEAADAVNGQYVKPKSS
jgi:hypothetical protein